MRKTAVQITKEAEKNLKKLNKGLSRKKVFSGVSKEIEKISQGMAISMAADHLPGLKAMLKFTTKNNINMNQETFNKAEFNRKCHKSTVTVLDKIMDKSGKKVDCFSVTINTKSGKNITIPDDVPFPAKNESVYTSRFNEKMDFIGKAFVNMLVQACEEELEILNKNFDNLKDQEERDGKSEN